VDSLGLKLVLTPALIGAASLAGRRWGPAVSGWLIGFPFTSAPVVFFLAINQGAAFAAAASAGTMAGASSQAAFCVAYAWLASRGWPIALGAGCLAFALSTAALQGLALPLPGSFALAISTLIVGLRVMPSAVPRSGEPATAAPRWDLGARMAVATAFVLLLTGVAPALGPRLTGLLAPFPLYGAVLAVFAHRVHGPASPIAVLRGLLAGLFGFTVFFLALALLLERAGTGLAFAAALALILALQAAALWSVRRRGGAAARRA
jgi:hypothetical protein